MLITESLALGSQALNPGKVWQGLLAYGNSVASKAVWKLRIHRTIFTIIVGASLAVARVVIQASTRNSLAEPGTPGINASTSPTVIVAVGGLGLTSVNRYLPFAFASAVATAVLVHVMTRCSADVRPTHLVLTGVALDVSLSSIAGTMTMHNSKAFDSYQFWMVGSLENRRLGILLWAVPFLTAGLVPTLAPTHSLNVLALGDGQTTALGVNPAVVWDGAFVAITLLCGTATTVVGPVSFIGLVIPYVARLLMGANQRRLLAWPAATGTGPLLATDMVGRLLVRPTELEVGIVTILVGTPVLLVLALTGRTVRGSA